MRFVISVAKQYQNRGLSLSDMINEGNIGLICAAKRFDETRGFKFISYAVWWIRQAIVQAICNQTRTVRLPLNRISSIKKVAKAVPYLENELLREPTNGEIAGHLHMSDDEIKLANKLNRKQISFDAPFLTDDHKEISMYDRLQDENIPSPDNNLLDESLAINISRILKKLNTKETKILTMSFGLCSTQVYSIHDIAEYFNMSTESIRQIRNKALDKLRNMVKDKNLMFY